MDAAKPSLDIVRLLTDEHVLRALMRHRRLTRAELAADIGISKPTAGESVRRLAERGLLVDTGERTQGGRGRGRVGSYYSLATDIGTALAVSIAPEGVVAERVDAYGDTVRRAERPARPDRVAEALREVAAEVSAPPQRIGTPEPHRHAEAPGRTDASDPHWHTEPARPPDPAEPSWHADLGGRPRLAVVSAADPVDRATGRLMHLPDSPFLVGELDPVEILEAHVAGPVAVDNDVNWAARAERASAGDEFAYLFLDRGLGCAIVGDGEVRRGSSGLAGEIAHLLTVGPDGRAAPFIEVFAQLGLRQQGSTAIDVKRLLAAGESTREAIGRAVAGVVAAAITLADPGRVVVGGSWGPALLANIRSAVAELPRSATVEAATVADQPSLAGARAEAVERLRAAIARSS
ncbi:ROK family transcriptional regulator [Actinoplanes sp. NPDC026619]|uniref:ROK family transcriptional regulator n=1 Tax=Actinoplanes sp. NPDC026619 TaxID=3155798 RepID=UPI00340BC0B5